MSCALFFGKIDGPLPKGVLFSLDRAAYARALSILANPLLTVSLFECLLKSFAILKEQ